MNYQRRSTKRELADDPLSLKSGKDILGPLAWRYDRRFRIWLLVIPTAD